MARFGGDEFLILQENISVAEARLTAERIRGRVGDFVFCDSGKTFHVGASIGVAEITGQTPAEHVLAAADAACYSAKRRGRNRVEIYQANDCKLAQLRNDSHWSTQLRQALKANTFELWFQPVVEIETGFVSFHEALLRMRNDRGRDRRTGGFPAGGGTLPHGGGDRPARRETGGAPSGGRPGVASGDQPVRSIAR